MKTVRIVLAALVIFAAGVITGGVGAGLAGRLIRQRSATVPEAMHLPAGSGATPATSPSGLDPTNVRGTNPAAPPAVAKPPGNAQIEAMARWTRELNLEAAQRERIDAILQRATARLRDLWAPVAPQARGEIEGARREIEDILTLDQRRQWNEARRRRTNAKPAPPPPADRGQSTAPGGG